MQGGLNAVVDTLAKRLKFARTHKQLTQTALSELSGVKQSDISKLEIGTSLKTTGLLRLAEALGCNPHWLDSGDGDPWDSRTVSIDLDGNLDYPAIRHVRFKLSAGASGFGVEYQDDQHAPIVFQRRWFEGRGLRPDRLFAVSVANGSMEPGLFDGDTVVVNTAAKDPKDGVVFAVNYEGELVIKRIVRDMGQWWLCSDNPDQRRYARKVCDEHCVIIGEIVHKQSERI